MCVWIWVGVFLICGSLGEKCRCADDHCHYCVNSVEGGKPAETCKRCRDGYNLLNNECVKECPANMASTGTSTFGRQCVVPFTCKSNKAVGMNLVCKCAEPNEEFPKRTKAKCNTCECEAGGYCEKCTKCNNGKFLYQGACEDNCDNRGLLSYLVGSYGGECRKPFTCENKKDSEGKMCKCPKSLGSCGSCDWELNDKTEKTHAVCMVCTKSQYLSDGACVKKCPKGTTADGDQNTGRTCKK